MNIIIYSINYHPDLIGIAKYNTEMAEWFVAQGHRVVVITAPPYYPAWKIKPPYSSWCFRKEVIHGVVVRRCPLFVPRKPSGVKRLLHLFSFALTSISILFSQYFFRPDIVFVVEPTLFCLPFSWLFSRFVRSKIWLHVQDFEVDAAIELHILPRSLQYIVKYIERRLMRRMDIVSTISNRMLELLHQKGVSSAKTFLFPNWVDIHAIFPLPGPNDFRLQLGLSSEDIVVLYSGNIGEKQGVEIIIDMARALESRRHIHFVICGNGSQLDYIQKKAGTLMLVHFLPLQPTAMLNMLLNMADIHVLPQKADAADLVMPSKLSGMLASGKAIVAMAMLGTQIAEVIQEIGVLVPPENVAALTEAILVLSSDVNKRELLGSKARAYVEQSLEKEKILTAMFNKIKLLDSKKRKSIGDLK